MKNRRIFVVIVYLIILGLIFSAVFSLFKLNNYGLTDSEVMDLFRNEQVKSFVVQNREIVLNLRAPYNGKDVVTAGLADPDGFRTQMWELLQEQTESGVLESYRFVPEDKIVPSDFIVPLLTVGAVLLFVWMLMVSRMNSNNPMNHFGKARTVSGLPGGKK